MATTTDYKIDQEVRNLRAAVTYAEYERDPNGIYEKYKELLPSFPECEAKKMIFKSILEETPKEEEDHTLYPFYDDEVEWLLSVNGEKTRKAMLCFVFWKKKNPHETGWIRYEPEKIFGLLFSRREVFDIIKRPALVTRCVAYGLDMRVVGSKNPIICYSLPKFEDSKEEEIYANVSAVELEVFWRHLVECK